MAEERRNVGNSSTAQQRSSQERRTLQDVMATHDSPFIIAIIGSIDFYHDDSPALCDAIGRELACHLQNKLCLWTGANAIIPKRLSKAYYNECIRQQLQPHIYHLAPDGYICDWDFGLTVTCGRDMDERRALLASCATVVVSIEGGPGAVDEMRKAVKHSVSVIPVIRSGGASGGLFGAPAIPCPEYVSVDDWELLSNEQAPIQTCAEAVVRIVDQIFKQQQQTGWKQQRPVKMIPFGHDEKPTFVNCADLVLDSNNSNFGNIYLGPLSTAGPDSRDELAQAGVAGIVNCTNRVPCYFSNDKSIKYCIVAVNDEAGANILAYLDGATTFLHGILCTGSSVLVHCEMGASRSATVVIAYMIRYLQMTRDDAYLQIKKCRPVVGPNPGFWRQLEQFEKWWHQDKAKANDDQILSDSNKDPLEINLDWCYQSCILYSTLRDLPHALDDKDCLQALQKPIVLRDMKQYASVWLDFIWGRGLIVSDLEWLSYCCSIVDKSNADIDGGVPSMAKVVISVAKDQDSDFGISWSGEIYPNQIQKVVKALSEE